MMQLKYPNDRQLCGEGTILHYSHSSSKLCEVVAGCTIDREISTAPCLPPLPLGDLHLTIDIGLLEPDLAHQLRSISLPFHYRCTFADPAIVHLVRLLSAELQAPQVMSQQFIDSIAIVLTTHLLRQWQIDRCQH